MNASEEFATLRRQLGVSDSPVIVFCKSHSGSRLLARLLMAGGIWLGDRRNESEDSADIIQIVKHFVNRYYPDPTDLFQTGDAALMDIALGVLTHHLIGRPPGSPWGWKLCETGYALPFFSALFPDARFVHLIRDGRDVAFCDHVAPANRFWRRIYFATDRIKIWKGASLSHEAYLRRPHLFNAQHWVNSVTTARAFGAMLGTRYTEVRYEDLVSHPMDTMATLESRLGLTFNRTAVAEIAATVHDRSVGKFRAMPRSAQRLSRSVLSPTLESFGYGLDEPLRRSAIGALLDGLAVAKRRFGRAGDAS